MTDNNAKGFLETQGWIYGKRYTRRKLWQRVVSLLCAITIFITTYAMILPAITISKEDPSLYSCGLQEHEHTEACYRRVLVCTKDEGEQTLPAWEKTLPTELSGPVGDRILKVAESQIGYKGSVEDTEYNETLDKRIGYTAFGGWNGTPYADDWNVIFAIYTLHYAGVDFADMPINASATTLMSEFEKAGMYESAAEHSVKAGDLVFFAAETTDTAENETEDTAGTSDTDESKSGPVVQTVGIVSEPIFDENGALSELLVIIGDSDNEVKKIRFSADDETIIGFATVSEEEQAEQPESCDDTQPDQTGLYDNTNSEQINPDDNAQSGEDTQPPADPAPSADPEAIKNIIISDPPQIIRTGSVHIHDDSCYEKELICTIPEHKHVDLCYYDLSGTRETQAEWEATIPALKGGWAENVVTVARSQIGYAESKDDYIETDGVRRGITRYGIWAGDPYADWSAMFASFVVSYAGVPTNKLVRHSDAAKWAQLLDRDGKYISTYFDDAFEPMAGDLVFFDFDADESKDAAYFLEPKGKELTKEDTGNSELLLTESGEKLLEEISEKKEELTDLEKDLLELTGQSNQPGANGDVQCAENLARIDGVGVIAEVTKDENGNIVSITVIEGDKDGEVKESVYEAGDLGIAGYAAMPEEEQSASTDLDFTVDGEIAPKAAMKFGRSLKAPTRAGGDTDIIINGLKVTLRAGAEQNAQGHWVKTPINSYADQRYTFRVSYAISGTYDYEPGQIEFRIPLSILRDRAGQPSDAFEISLLFEGDPAVSASTVFVYRIDTNSNELVIYNRIDCPAGQNGYFEIAYLTTKKTYEYADYGTSNVVTPDGASDSFYADLSITQNETTKTAQSDRIPVYMDTSARIYSISKAAPSFYEQWNPTWGNAPADHDQWCYLVWEIRTVIMGTTQPYDFVIFDTPLNRDFEVVGYEMEGATGFSATNRAENIKTDYEYGRYDLVLTKHKKSTYHNQLSYDNTLSFFTLTNRIKGTVIPCDNGQPAATSATAEKSWKYEQRSFDKPVGHFYARKYGYVHDEDHVDDFERNFVIDSEQHVASYALDDFRDADTGASISNLRYFAKTHGYPLPWTIPANVSETQLQTLIWETWHNDLTTLPELLSQYYRREPVTYCLDDQDLYLGKIVGRDDQLAAGVFTEINKAYLDNPSNGNIKLGAGEYRIDSLKLHCFSKDANYNIELNEWLLSRIEETDYNYYVTGNRQNETVRVYVYLHGSAERVHVATLDLHDGNFINVNNAIVERDIETTIFFKDSANVRGYYMETTNSHYYTSLGVFPTVTLFKTGNVETFVNNLDSQEQLKLRLANYSTHWINEDRKGPNATQMGGPNQVKGTDFERIGFNYVAGIVPKGELTKNVVAARNDVANTNFTVWWRTDAQETYLKAPGEKAFINQKSGVLFDLLPAGSTLDLDSVKVFADSKALRPGEYTVETSIHSDTGRILLTIRINCAADKYSSTYATIHDWSDIKIYGDTMLNSVAYETGNKKIGDGGPDTGYSSNQNILRIQEWELMANLDPASQSDIDPTTNQPYARFLYAEASYQIGVPVSARLGLDKKVRAQTDSRYSYATTTYTGNEYYYALDYSVDSFSKAKDIVLFDSLENYITPAGMASEWHGTLTGWDTSVPETLGCKPVVYLSENSYSNFSSMESTTGLTGDFDLRSAGWVRSDLYTGDLKNVKSIAFDLRFQANGDEFILDEDGSVTVYIYMRAPNTAVVGAEKLWAYNNVWLHNTQIHSATGGSETKNIHQDYTRIGYVLSNELVINKFDRTNDGAVSGTTFRLWGTAFDGSEIDRLLTTGDTGTVKFENIPCGSYTLMEVATTPEYLYDHTPVYVTVGADGRFSFSMTGTLESNQAAGERPYTLTNGDTVLHVVPDPAGVPLTRFSVTLSGETTLDIGNAPRVYGDLSFKKLGMVDGAAERIELDGIQFKLSGVSDYGTDVLMYATSDSSGRVYFSNIEKGRYKLEEVATIAHYFIPNYTWTVHCDGNGNVTMTGEKLESTPDGYMLTNEPLHEIKLRKVDADNQTIGLKDAVFRLYGTSDSGRPVDITAYSDSNGVVTFAVESGRYILQEIQAPASYNPDSTRRAVTVQSDGTVTINGLTRISGSEAYFNYWEVKNERNLEGLLNIRKDWGNDNPGERRNPVIHVSTEEPEFPEIVATIDLKKWNTSGIKSQLRSSSTVDFQRNTDTDKTRSTLPGNAKQIDDGTGLGQIWWWKGDDGVVYWWSDAAVVYLPEDCSEMFACGYYPDESSITELDLSGFHPGKIKNMSKMFYYRKNLEHIDFTGWANKMTGNLENMESAFEECSSLRQLQLNNWNVSNVTSFKNVFRTCRAITTINTANWDVSKATDFSGAFYNCFSVKRLDLSHWNPASATDMSLMFGFVFSSSSTVQTTLEELNVSGWNLSNVENMSAMFRQCEKLKNLDLSTWTTSNKLNDTHEMFSYCILLESLNLNCLNMTNVTDLHAMFYNCEALKQLEIGSWNVANATNIESVFSGCKELTAINVANWNVSKVKSAKNLFLYCSKLRDLNLDGWKFSVEYTGSAEQMFSGCGLLDNIGQTKGKDLFTGAKATSWKRMFNGCAALEYLDCGDWYAVHVEDMEQMFNSAANLRLPQLKWQTTSLKNCAGMFYNCGFRLSSINLILSGWDTSQLTNMSNAFRLGNAPGNGNRKIYLEGWKTNALTTNGVQNVFGIDTNPMSTWRIYVSDDWICNSNIVAQSNFFADCWGLTGGSGTVYNSARKGGTYARVDGQGGNPGYFTRNNSYTVNVQTRKTAFDPPNSASGTNSANAGAQGRFSFAANAGRLSGAGQQNAVLPNAAQPLRAPTRGGGTVAIEYVTYDAYTPTGGGANADIYDTWYPDSVDTGVWWYRMRIFDGYEQSLFPLTFYVWEDPLPGYDSDTGRSNYMKVVYNKAADGTVTVTAYRIDAFDSGGNIIWVESPNGLQIKNTKNNDETPKGFRIRKQVTGQTARPEDFNRAFKFSIKLYSRTLDWSTWDYIYIPKTDINGVYGDVTFVDGEAVVYLKHGEEVWVTGLPNSTYYEIKELDGDDYLASEFTIIADGNDLTNEGIWGTALPNQMYIVTLTNARNSASLLIAKLIETPNGEELTELDLQRSFTVNVTFYGYESEAEGAPLVIANATTVPALPDGIYGDLLVRGGKATAYLRHDESVTLTGLPLGLTYVVEEEFYNGYTVSYFGESGDFKGSGERLALITNTKVPDSEHPTGGFTVRKQVADYTTNEQFTFHVDLSGLDANLVYKYTVIDAAGSETTHNFTSAPDGTAHVIIVLKDGESVRFEGLPATEYEYDANDPTLITGVIREGAKYTVSEERSGFVASYTVVDNNNTGNIASGSGGNTSANEELATANETVDAGEDIVITFTNTRRRFEIPFAKVDDQGTMLAGAHLQVQTVSGEVVNDWVTDDNLMTLALPAGEYRLVELSPPEGYSIALPVEFTVDETGVITDSASEYIYVVSMTDEPIEIVIHKKDDDVDHPKYVNGATLRLFEYGKVDKNGIFIYDRLSNRLPLFTWITGEEGKTLSGGLTYNTVYRLHEAETPNGYETAQDILFVIGADGSLIPVEFDVYDESTAATDPNVIHGTGTAPASALRNVLVPQSITVGAANAQGTLELFRNSHANGLTYLGKAEGHGKAFHLTPAETAVDPGAIDETYFSEENMVFREESGGGVYTYYVVNFGDSEHFAAEAQYAEKLVVMHNMTFTGASGNELTMTDVANDWYHLPETGGPGVYLFTISGLLLLFGGAGCIIYRKKRRKEVIREG